MSRAPELNELNVLQEVECKLIEDEELKAVLEAYRLTGHAGRNTTHLFLKERMRFPDMYAMVSQVAVTARHVYSSVKKISLLSSQVSANSPLRS